MATYKQIQAWVKQKYGFMPETCWIAHVKHLSGMPMRKAHNRKGAERVKPCPSEKVEPIRHALMHFGMISGDCFKRKNRAIRFDLKNVQFADGKLRPASRGWQATPMDLFRLSHKLRSPCQMMVYVLRY